MQRETLPYELLHDHCDLKLCPDFDSFLYLLLESQTVFLKMSLSVLVAQGHEIVNFHAQDWRIPLVPLSHVPAFQ